MMNILATAALVGAALAAQNTSLPKVDLGYEIYQAASFNVNIPSFSSCKISNPFAEYRQLF